MAKLTPQYVTVVILYVIYLSGSLPKNHALPFLKYHDSKISKLNDKPFIRKVSSDTIAKECNEKIIFSETEAKDVVACVFQQKGLQTTTETPKNLISEVFERCLQHVNKKYLKSWCDEYIKILSNTVITYESLRIQPKIVTTRTNEMAKDFNKKPLKKIFRVKRELTSETSEDCETKLKESFECYRSELSSLATTLENHKNNALTLESRVIHQNKAGCDLINNILNKCDQLLCNPTSHSGSNVESYNEYVRTVLPGFDVKKCTSF